MGTSTNRKEKNMTDNNNEKFPDFSPKRVGFPEYYA
jgi:hypothetical protein